MTITQDNLQTIYRMTTTVADFKTTSGDGGTRCQFHIQVVLLYI